MKFTIQIASVLLAAASVGAQTAPRLPEVQQVRVTPSGDDVEIEVVVSAAARARMVSAPRPKELVLEIAGAIPGDKVRAIVAGQNGVNSVRVELRHTKPARTWVVVVLEEARAYGLAQNENKITLHLLPVMRAGHEPAKAVQPSILGRLGGRKQSAASADAVQSVELTPPPAEPAIAFPGESRETEGAAKGDAGGAEAGGDARRSIDSGGAGTGSFSSVSGENGVNSASGVAHVSSGAEAGRNNGEFDARVAKPASGGIAADERAGGETSTSGLPQPNSDIRVAFKVKYVIDGVAYLEGGRDAALAEGVTLFVRETDPVTGRPAVSADGEPKAVAGLRVIAVAETSAATEIHDPTRAVKPGDWAFLSAEDTNALVTQRSLSATRKYPVVVSFTAEDDALDDEARAEVVRPPLPEINRARGRIGFDYSGVSSPGGSSNSLGLVIRTDMTRINGTYWNLSGYWRGRLTSTSSGQATLQDLINRTYHLGLTYDNPQSRWVAGVGRLYLPWASSLDTIDGGYFGRRVGGNAILGVFGGSTPDPTSWSYNPNRHIGGGFVNFEGGSFEGLRYSSTSGVGISLLKGAIDRPFVFLENGVSYKGHFSIYHSLQADSPRGNPAVPAPGAGISRSFLTVRVQPTARVELDFNHTYFRDFPTFDPQLIGTGLLDKYLFQGFSAGARVEVARKIWVYTNLGRSNRTGDAQPSLNQMYGVTFGSLPWTGIRADFRYSKFDGSFGAGSYKALSLSRNFRDNLRWDVLAGSQSFASGFSRASSARFLTGNVELNVGANYFVQGGYTRSWGGLQNYNQWMFTFGYRFDNRSRNGEK